MGDTVNRDRVCGLEKDGIGDSARQIGTMAMDWYGFGLDRDEFGTGSVWQEGKKRLDGDRRRKGGEEGKRKR